MRLLLIDDSPTVLAYLQEVLAERDDVELLPAETDGLAAVDAARRLNPDLILMDLQLPGLSGLEAIRRIMAERARPMVVLSALVDRPDGEAAFESLRAGALDVLAKPRGLDRDSVDEFRRRLFRVLDTVGAAQLRMKAGSAAAAPTVVLPRRDFRMVVMGSSMGGLPVVHRLLEGVPAPFPLPLVVAHHIGAGFEASVTTWLGQSGHRVELAADGARPQRGVVYLAPGGADTSLTPTGFRLSASARDGPSPSIDALFESAARLHGARVVGVILSGMGDDGSRGAGALAARGALVATQASQTCLVDGMPAAARERRASHRELGPEGLVALLRRVAEVAQEG